MNIPTTGWSNKRGTADRACVCGTWKQHWINLTNKQWPATCSREKCSSTPTLGGHVFNPSVDGERIVPLCESCNKFRGTFTLKNGTPVPLANKARTCEKKA